jgi:ubiquinone/menaquinone biosynthesis C-methylase UbiE
MFGSEYGHGILKIYYKLLGIPALGKRIHARAFYKHLYPYIQKSHSILDLGCGWGYYSIYLGKKGFNIVSIDLSPNRVKKAKQVAEKEKVNSNLNFLSGDITLLPFASNTFDVVLCLDVLEYVKNDDKAVSEISRVLKPQGLVLMLLLSAKRIYTKFDAGHVRDGYIMEELPIKFKKYGLIILETCYFRKRYSSIALKLNKFVIDNCKTLQPFIFPLLYPLTYLDSIDNNSGDAISVVCRKVK